MLYRPISTALASVAALALLLTGCNASATPAPTENNTIPVVASTNVYGDIVKAIGGDKVTVESLINKTSQDPHSYEASAQDKLLVSKAKLVVENGGGYDGFLHKLAEDTGVADANIVTAVEVSGLAPGGETAPAAGKTPEAGEHEHDGEFNEHVWYSLDAMAKLADALAAKLSALDSGSASTFTSNAEAFKGSLAGLHGKLDELNSRGASVAATEPVPLYLLEAAGLVNKTPEAFMAAIEEGTDVPPAILKETQELAASMDTRFLAYNDQTESTQTEAVKEAALTAGAPVVEFTETLPDGIAPDGKGYVRWMTSNVENISKALGR